MGTRVRQAASRPPGRRAGPAAGQRRGATSAGSLPPRSGGRGALLNTLEAAPERAPAWWSASSGGGPASPLHAISRWVATLPDEARGGRPFAFSNVRLALLSPVFMPAGAARRRGGADGHHPPRRRRWRSPSGGGRPSSAMTCGRRRRPPSATTGACRSRADGRVSYARAASCLPEAARAAGHQRGHPAATGRPLADGTRPVYVTRRYVCKATTGGATPSLSGALHADSLKLTTLAQVSALLESGAGSDRGPLTPTGPGRRTTERSYEASAGRRRVGRPTARPGADRRQAARSQTAMTAVTERYVEDA